MEIRLLPDIEAYALERVRSGDYLSVEEVVNAAVLQLRDDEHQLSDEDLRAIDEGEADFAACRFMDFKTFAEEMRKQDAP